MEKINFEDVQSDEIIFLQSTYGDDFEEVWKRQQDQPYHFKIRVFPDGCLDPASIHCEAKLDILLPPRYPHKSAIVKVHKRDVKGLSASHTEELRKNLHSLASSSVPDEACYRLVLETATFLSAHNIDRTSLDKERLDRLEEEEEERRKKEKKQRDKQLQDERRRKSIKVEKIQLKLESNRKAVTNRVYSTISPSPTEDTFPVCSPLSEPVSESDADPFMSPLLGAFNHLDQKEDGFEFDMPPLSEQLELFEDDDDDPAGNADPLMDDFKSKSRYESYFEEQGMLGSGGFGVVVKVRNKLDGLLYAVKKIKLKTNNSSALFKILREVTTIARLQHKHIVRYYQSWVETVTGDDDSEKEDDEYSDYVVFDDDQDNPDDALLRGSIASKTNLLDFNMLDESSDEDSGINSENNSGDDLESSESSISTGPTRYLYIQMEYCPKDTLRDLIDKGMQPDLIWRLFRQLLEAIEFIHKKNVIHRDIKPPNVFIGSNSNVKLGDFGLATTGQSAKIVSPQEHTDFPSSADSSKHLEFTHQMSIQNRSLTEAVGTAFYRAVEQEQPGGRISVQADMFSLGVVFFEMWSRFDTGMERMITLEDLRKHRKVPEEFRRRFEEVSEEDDTESSNFDKNVPKIIEMLLEHEPSKRPSATQLLQSGLIPIEIHDIQMEHAVAEICRTESKHKQKVLESFFESNHDDIADCTYDSESQKTVNRDLRSVKDNPAAFWKYIVKMRVKDRIPPIFRNHGAVEIKTPLLTPRIDKANDRSVCFLDPSGMVVSLPFHLTKSFARYVAQNSITALRRFCLSRVYRETAPGQQPDQFEECHFDLIYPAEDSDNSCAASEAETIVVAHEILQEFPEVVGDFYVRISHLQIFDAILDECESLADPPTHQTRQEILEAMMDNGRQSLSEIRNYLLKEKNIPKSVVNKLMRYGNLTGKIDEPATMAQVLKAFPDNEHVSEAVSHLNLVFDFLAKFECTANVKFDAGLVTTHYDYCQGHTGMIFQVVLKSQARPFDVFALGGRYDSLVQQYRPPGSTAPMVAAVGVNLGIEKLYSAFFERARDKPLANLLQNKTSESSVLLYSHNDDFLPERAHYAKLLWKQKIRAEYIMPYALNINEAQVYCSVIGIRWLIRFQNSKLNRGLVTIYDIKLRHKKSNRRDSHMKGKPTVQVPLIDICRWIRNQKAAAEAHKGSVQKSTEEIHVTVITRWKDFKTNRVKKTKSAAEARKYLAPLIKNLSPETANIASIEVPFEDIRACTEACMPLVDDDSDDDKMKQYLASVNTDKRKELLKSLVEHIKRCINEEKTQFLYIYSSRDNKADLMCVLR